MLSLYQIQEKINSNSVEEDILLKRYRDVYYGMSLHISGACPRYMQGERWVVPHNYFGEEYQYIFDNFILNRHPRESQTTRWWRYSQYKPLTKAPFGLIIEIISAAMFQDSNYAIVLNNENDNEYILSKAFNEYTLIQYFQWMIQNIMEDPNGFFITVPKEPYYNTTTKYIEPDIWFINSKDIIFKSKDEIIFKRDGIVWVVNRYAFFRFENDPKSGWVMMDNAQGGYYTHGFGYLPINIAGGVWNTQGFFDSWIGKGKPIADEFATAKSSDQLVDKEASHPFITIAQVDCPECDNHCGYKQIGDPDCPDECTLEKCDVCGGTGHVSQNPGERLEAPPELMGNDLIKITNPDVAINKYLFEKSNILFDQIIDSLNLKRAEDRQSGVAKAIDQERLYQFIQKISNDIFMRIIYNTIRDIVGYRNIKVVDGVNVPDTYEFVVISPTQFHIKTAADLLEDYTKGMEANIPAFIRADLMKDYVAKQFSGNRVMQKKSNLIIEMDYLSVYNTDEKEGMLLINEVTLYDLQYSVHLPNMLDEVIRDKGDQWFLRAGFDEINSAVEIIFNRILNEQKIENTKTQISLETEPQSENPENDNGEI